MRPSSCTRVQSTDCSPPVSQVLAPSARSVNINAAIMDMYLEHLMPEMTQPGDDHNYGSAAMYDVMILQVGDVVDVGILRAHSRL